MARVLPAMRTWSATGGSLRLSDRPVIVVDPGSRARIDGIARALETELNAEIHVRPRVREGGPEASAIFLTIDCSDSDLGVEGYRIEITDRVIIRAPAPAGVFYGTRTLLQMLRTGHGVLPCGAGRDYPAFKERALMIDAGRKFWQMKYLEDLMRQMAWLKLNCLHLHFTEWNAFRLVSDTYPGLADPNSYTKNDVRRLEAVARENFITIIPEIDLPAHASVITTYNPSLGFTSPSMRREHQGPMPGPNDPSFTIDVTRREVRDWVRALHEEFLDFFAADTFHIGGDEWPYDDAKRASPEMMNAMRERGYPYPGDIFVEWINEVNELVKSKGKRTRLWTWWSFSKNDVESNITSLTPNRDIVIDVWNDKLLREIVNAGYECVFTPEEALYVTPGDGKKIGDYGYVDSDAIYRTHDLDPDRLKGVGGLKVCVWANKMEEAADLDLERYLVRPRAVLAERAWTGPTDGNAAAFYERFNSVGNASGTDLASLANAL